MRLTWFVESGWQFWMFFIHKCVRVFWWCMSSAYCVVSVDSEIATRSSKTKGKSIQFSFEIRF